jgi:hypothetical protein
MTKRVRGTGALLALINDGKTGTAVAPAAPRLYDARKQREREESEILEGLNGSKYWLLSMVAFAVRLGYTHYRTVMSGGDCEFDRFLAALGARWAEATPEAHEYPRAYSLFFQREMLKHRAIIEETFPSKAIDGRRIYYFGLAGTALTYCTQFPPSSRIDAPEPSAAKAALRVRFEEPEDVYFKTCAQHVLTEMEARARRPPLLYPNEVPPLPGMDAVSVQCFRRVLAAVGPGLATLYDPAFYWARTGILSVRLPPPRRASAAAVREFGMLVGKDGMRMVTWARRMLLRYHVYRRSAEAKAMHVVADVVAANMRWAGDLATAVKMIDAAFAGFPGGPIPRIRLEMEAVLHVLDVRWHCAYYAGVCAALSGDASGAASHYAKAHGQFERHYAPETSGFLAFLAEEICISAHYAPAHARTAMLISMFKSHAPQSHYERLTPLLDSATRRATQNEAACKRRLQQQVAHTDARYEAFGRRNSIHWKRSK